MKRLRRLTKETTLGVVLSMALSIPAAIPPTHVVLAIAVPAIVTQSACGTSDLSQLHDILNKTAKALDKAIDTNGQLYEKGLYGPAGSAEAVAKLHKGAQIIKDAALHLQTALNLAKGLTKETFEAGKLSVLDALSKAVASMPVTGSQTLDLVLKSVATLINQAVALVQLFNAGDVKHIQIAIPKINGYIKEFQRIAEVSV